MLHPMRDGSSLSARILIVEDDRDTAESMARLLKLFGYQVDVAREGAEALALAARQQPHFVLLDIGLPGMDGYNVAMQLKREASCKETVIIAVTGYGQSEDRERSCQAGIDHHLVKPIDHGSLLALLVQTEVSAPELRNRRPARKRSADTAHVTAPGPDHDAAAPGPSDPASGVPALLLSCRDWPGGEVAARSVPSRFTGEGWDR